MSQASSANIQAILAALVNVGTTSASSTPTTATALAPVTASSTNNNSEVTTPVVTSPPAAAAAATTTGTTTADSSSAPDASRLVTNNLLAIASALQSRSQQASPATAATSTAAPGYDAAPASSNYYGANSSGTETRRNRWEESGRDYGRERSQSPGRPGAQGGDYNAQSFRNERREERTSEYSGGNDYNGGAARQWNSHAHSDADEVDIILVDPKMVGLIIGRQGANLRRIEGENNCSVQFLGPGNNGLRKCQITGPRSGIESTKTAIYKVIEDANNPNAARPPRSKPGPYGSYNNTPDYRGAGEGANMGASGGYGAHGEAAGGEAGDGTGNEDHLQIMVPDRTVGLIIGRGGETITDLQERSGCHINILHESMSVQGLRPVNLMGTAEQMAKAKELIMEVVDSDSRDEANAAEGGAGAGFGKKTYSRGGEEYGRPSYGGGGRGGNFSQGGSGYGYGGYNQQSYGTNSNDMNSPNSPTSGGGYRGGYNNQRGNNSYQNGGGGYGYEGGHTGGGGYERDSMIIPSEYVGVVIGRGGETIRDIQSNTECKITVTQPTGPNETERTVLLSGAPENIGKARQAIEEKIESVRTKNNAVGGSGYIPNRRPYNANASSSSAAAAAYGQQPAPQQALPPAPGTMDAYGAASAAAGQQQQQQQQPNDPYAPYGGYQNYVALLYQQWSAAQANNASATPASDAPPS